MAAKLYNITMRSGKVWRAIIDLDKPHSFGETIEQRVDKLAPIRWGRDVMREDGVEKIEVVKEDFPDVRLN